MIQDEWCVGKRPTSRLTRFMISISKIGCRTLVIWIDNDSSCSHVKYEDGTEGVLLWHFYSDFKDHPVRCPVSMSAWDWTRVLVDEPQGLYRKKLAQAIADPVGFRKEHFQGAEGGRFDPSSL
jgi:hypothetical protein